MRKIAFVSSNTNKYQLFGDIGLLAPDAFVYKKHSLPEYQTTNAKKLILHKALSAWDIISPPFFVHDSWLEIPRLKGFPGPYSKYIESTLSIKGVDQLITDGEEACFFEICCLVDEDGVNHFFESSLKGTLDTNELKHFSKSKWSSYADIFIPRKSRKVLSLFTSKELASYIHSHYSNYCIQQLVNHIKDSNG